MPSPNAEPVTLTGHLEPDLSRGLWLVKWLLLIPHAVVLFFLWVAAGVLTVVAWFAILVTGRYPRSIFDFNVGVLRWSWRVWFYGYGALGTDRYPPFTLAHVPDYPATLQIDYPERLSRGLVLVKSWLLAIPHYLVLGFFLGAGIAVDPNGGRPAWPWSVGLVGLLVLVAAVVLLFTGGYPRPLFDLVLGMDRWAARVAAYVLLMTDVYPPFRLDQGGDEPALPRPADPGGTGGAPAAAAVGRPPSASQPRWTTLRIVGLATGSVLLALSLFCALAGTALVIADRGLRDHDGFLMTGGERLSTTTYAVTTGTVELDLGSVAHAVVGDVKLTAHGSSRPVFVGIAPTRQVDAYLAGVAHRVVTDLRGGTPHYRAVPGGPPSSAPAGALTWSAQASGEGTQTLRWNAARGRWTAVLMNADGSGGVSAVVSAGATLPVVGWGAVTLLVAAALLVITGLLLVLVALPRSPAPTPTDQVTPVRPPGRATTGPAT